MNDDNNNNKRCLSFLPEGVVIMIVSCLELEIHEINGTDGGSQEEYLHGRVIQGNEIGE